VYIIYINIFIIDYISLYLLYIINIYIHIKEKTTDFLKSNLALKISRYYSLNHKSTFRNKTIGTGILTTGLLLLMVFFPDRSF
jgi:hypothetical protein